MDAVRIYEHLVQGTDCVGTCGKCQLNAAPCPPGAGFPLNSKCAKAANPATAGPIVATIKARCSPSIQWR